MDNEPVDVKNVKIGETAMVAKNELSELVLYRWRQARRRLHLTSPVSQDVCR